MLLGIRVVLPRNLPVKQGKFNLEDSHACKYHYVQRTQC